MIERKPPAFFMKCCYDRIVPMKAMIVHQDKIVIEFYCWYCGRTYIFESKNGIKIENEEKPTDIKLFYIANNGIKKKVREDTCGQVFI